MVHSKHSRPLVAWNGRSNRQIRREPGVLHLIGRPNGLIVCDYKTKWHSTGPFFPHVLFMPKFRSLKLCNEFLAKGCADATYFNIMAFKNLIYFILCIYNIFMRRKFIGLTEVRGFTHKDRLRTPSEGALQNGHQSPPSLRALPPLSLCLLLQPRASQPRHLAPQRTCSPTSAHPVTDSGNCPFLLWESVFMQERGLVFGPNDHLSDYVGHTSWRLSSL